jgi:uncharacterized membrane protein
MQPRLVRWVCGGVSAAGVVGYALLAHVVFASGQGTRAAAVIAWSPLALTLLWLAWGSRWRVHVVLGGGAATILLLSLWPRQGLDVSLVYLAQYLALQGALATLFGRTLLPGREPLVTGFARMLHGELPPPIARYARAVTAAWVLFFAAMAATAVLLYLFAPRAAWSAFVNLLTLPCVVAMFGLEYMVRRLRYPWFEHASLLAGVRVFQRSVARRQS